MNITHILNCHLCAASELTQVKMIALSNQYLTIFFRYDEPRSWNAASPMFAVETLFTTGESIIANQRVFSPHFMLRQNDAILDRISNPEQYEKFLFLSPDEGEMFSRNIAKTHVYFLCFYSDGLGCPLCFFNVFFG